MQNIFGRYEEKYLITYAQKTALLETISKHIAEDKFANYIVQNLYYDTENWDVVRNSIESPLYKEKMRLRCYGRQAYEAKLFLELKKKYKGVVYKRRAAFSNTLLSSNDVRDIMDQKSSQILRELQFYLKANSVYERIYLSYKRSAFTGVVDKDLRITFDTDIRYRIHDLEFTQPENGIPVLTPDQTIMEIKIERGMPLWLVHALGENKVYPISFSKCGTCYTDYIRKQQKGDVA